MNNRLTLQVGKKSYDLLFNFGSLRFIKDVTGTDPLKFSFDTDDYDSLSYGASVLMYAGLLSAAEEKKKAIDVSLEDVKEVITVMTTGQIVSVIKSWGYSKRIDASGEGGKDTRE